MAKHHNDIAHLRGAALRRLDFELLYGCVTARDLQRRFSLSAGAMQERAAALGVDLGARDSYGLSYAPPEALDSGCFRYRGLAGGCSIGFEKEEVICQERQG